MSELTIFNGLLIGWFILGAVVFVTLFFINAPYGRHVRQGWGYTIGNKLGWIIMEAPAPVIFGVLFFHSSHSGAGVPLAFMVLWEAHYLHRAFVYPFSLRGTERRMPLAVVSFGILFNTMNGYLNGRYIYTFSNGYGTEWLTDPRFIMGVLLFITGFIINRRADFILRNMRKTGESGYEISYDRLYRWISCPNYLGEITIWVGWALATWSLAGLAFAFWTMANLLPRARANHAWYKATFPDYPEERKALVPGVW